jgi:hypothetical protein
VKPEGGPKLKKRQTKNYAFLVLNRRVSSPPHIEILDMERANFFPKTNPAEIDSSY